MKKYSKEHYNAIDTITEKANAKAGGVMELYTRGFIGWRELAEQLNKISLQEVKDLKVLNSSTVEG